MKQITENKIETYKHIDNCKLYHCSHCGKCIKTNFYGVSIYHDNYHFFHCKKCHIKFDKATKQKDKIYINNELQEWIKKLTDLFCLDHTPIVILKFNTPSKRHLGLCHWNVTPIVIDMTLDHNGMISLKTLIHEFLHASGYDHAYELNGWAHFGKRINGFYHDEFCKLILKDLTGKKEMMI